MLIVHRFRALGKRVFYVTNNSTKHRREYKDKVDKLGFGGDLEDIIGKLRWRNIIREHFGGKIWKMEKGGK